MRSNSTKILVALLAFGLALGGGLLLFERSRATDVATGGPAAGIHQAENGVWSEGDTWTVRVRQDSGAITPSGDTNVAIVPFRFRVEPAPEVGPRAWLVHVTQDGAEGPFAKGWNLHYVEKGGAMVLHRVAVGDEPPLEAELAAIVLGPQFPYETRYESAPKDRTVDAQKLERQAQLPPSELPKGSTPGAAPPAAAPAVGAGAAP